MTARPGVTPFDLRHDILSESSEYISDETSLPFMRSAVGGICNNAHTRELFNYLAQKRGHPVRVGISHSFQKTEKLIFLQRYERPFVTVSMFRISCVLIPGWSGRHGDLPPMERSSLLFSGTSSPKDSVGYSPITFMEGCPHSGCAASLSPFAHSNRTEGISPSPVPWSLAHTRCL